MFILHLSGLKGGTYWLGSIGSPFAFNGWSVDAFASGDASKGRFKHIGLVDTKGDCRFGVVHERTWTVFCPLCRVWRCVLELGKGFRHTGLLGNRHISANLGDAIFAMLGIS